MDMRDTVWHRARDVWLACFRVFFGSLPAFLNQGWRLREVGAGVFSGMARNHAQAYYLPITGIEDAKVVRDILNQDMGSFLLRNGLTMISFGEDVLSFQSAAYSGALAHLRILKQGWQFIVPSNFFSGSSYTEMEKKWDGIAKEMARVLSDRYA